MNNVALRHQAVFIPAATLNPVAEMTPESGAFASMLGQYGYEVTEELLHALNGCSPEQLNAIAADIRQAYNVGLNWSALVRGWQTPTGETVADHIITLFQNVGVVNLPSVTLPCGHRIPEGTFPLERYTGCPFCGKPFTTSNYVYTGQGSKKKLLTLWTETELQNLLRSYLESRVPLDASAMDSLKELLGALPAEAVIKSANIEIKEIRILAASALIDRSLFSEALELLKTPNDFLRLIFYRNTGNFRIIPPRVYRNLDRQMSSYGAYHDAARGGVGEMLEKLRFKFSRTFSKEVARWLCGLSLSDGAMCEDMHRHRELWVHMIRALRLAEFSHKAGMERLARLLDLFYRSDYRVWQGEVDEAIRRNDAGATFRLMQQRPGIFARSLFSLIARFGLQPTMEAFGKVLSEVEPRILLRLSSMAEEYFLSGSDSRSVGAPGLRRVTVDIPENVRKLSVDERTDIIVELNQLYVKAMEERFAKEPAPAGPIYIAPELYDIPVPVGERNTVKSDLPVAYQGQRFHVEGDAVRIFLQWGVGLPAQHLDMDVSAILLGFDKRRECAYYDLSFPGARHSGDMRQIPDMVGTAEYVELTLSELYREGWLYAAFTCNAYSCDELDPRLVVGWMSSAYPMKVSEETGVAYDPSTVQHMVRISESNIMRGLLFGVLDIHAKIIYWMEMPLVSRVANQINTIDIMAFLKRLKARPMIGQMLADKAAIQGTPIVTNPAEAAVIYDTKWALNPAEVAKTLL